MLKGFLSVALALFVMNVANAPAVFARSQVDEQTVKLETLKADIRKLGVGKEAHVQVRLKDGKKLKGYVREVRDNEFVVVEEKTGIDTTIPYAQVAQLKGHNKLTAAKVGITVAKAVGIVAAVAAAFTLLMYIVIPKS